MSIAKFFIYFVVMIVCGISIIEADTLLIQISLLVGVIISFMLAFSAITEIKEQC